MDSGSSTWKVVPSCNTVSYQIRPPRDRDYIVGDGQSHAHSSRLGGEVGLKQFIPYLLGYAFPVIGKSDPHHLVLRRSPEQCG